MPIDASIYQNAQPIQMPSVADAATKALTLSNLGLQNQQAQYQMQSQRAIRDAYANNVKDDGTVDQQGVLSDLARNAPQAYMQTAQGMAAMQKAQAETQTAKMQAAHQVLSITQPAMEYLASLPESERAAAYPSVMKQLGDQGAPMTNVPSTYDQGWFRQAYLTGRQTKEALDNQLTQVNINKGQAETNAMPAKINSDLYGSRSPNAELSSQYTQDVKPIRNSQIFMQQMLDSYKNKTPQGDAALVLNNFKIRNPQAVDVNSIEEMKNSQAVGDAWKNKLSQALNGGFDTQTRDNLIRDGISAYRANMNSLQGIQQRYQARAKAQNVNDPTLTYEPAIDATNKESMALQDQIGKYVPPSQRSGGGGIVGGIEKIASRLMGGAPEQSADASDKQAKSQYRAVGSQVSSDEVSKYAMKHGMTAAAAQNYLRSQGYVIGR